MWHDLPEGMVFWTIFSCCGFALIFYPVFTRDIEKELEE